MDFEWDENKFALNLEKHGVSFFIAQHAFSDPKRVIRSDRAHSSQEERYFCMGKIDGRVLTVRFTYRNGKIRIFGAGYWREGKTEYEKKSKVR